MGQAALFAGAILAAAAVISGLVRPAFERRLTAAAMVALSVAAAHLVVLLATQDTSYVLVVDHTRPGLDLARRVMGLWGGSAGSLLVFTLIVGWTLVVAPLERPLAIARPVVVGTLSWALVAAVAPFERLATPAIAGSGLSPILEHWAMLIHPPLLYLGLGLALVPGAVAPEERGRWSTASIGVLTTALALGGGWAYVELGWGGWWAWDPVENAALIPWLLLVAGLHLTPEHSVARWSALLIWPAVFAGTAMTRTSLRTSVHAFADSETLGWVLWPLALAVSVAAAAHGLRTVRVARSSIRQPSGLAVLALLASAVIVALGTFRPFLPGDATDGSFYARYLFPVAVAGLVALGVAPRVGQLSTLRLGLQATLGFVMGLAAGALVEWSSWWQLTLAGALGAALCPTLSNGARPWNRTLAHVGMVLVLAGALGATASTTQTFSMDLDSREMIEGHALHNRGVELTSDDPPVLTATIDVDGHVLQPSLTFYPERGLRLPEVATHRRIHRDVQLILRSADDSGTATITVNVEPLTQLTWFGSALIVAAMVVSTVASKALASRSVASNGVASSQIATEGQSDRFSRRDRSSSLTVADEAGAGAEGGSTAPLSVPELGDDSG